MRPLAGITLTAASLLLLTACISAPAPAPASSPAQSPSASSTAATLDELAAALVDDGAVTFASIEEGAGHDDHQGLVLELSLADDTDGTALAALVDDLQPQIDAALGDARPERTYLALAVTHPDGGSGFVDLHSEVSATVVAAAVDLVRDVGCEIVETLDEQAGRIFHAGCEGSLEPGAATATIDDVTAHAFTDPTIDAIRWGIYESVSTAVTLTDPSPAPGEAIDGILTTSAGLDVRLVRIEQVGSTMDLSGLITAPDPAVCESLWQQLAAASATTGTVRLGLADGDGTVSSDDDRGCTLTR